MRRKRASIHMKIETPRLVIRKFKYDDWRDYWGIAISKQKSPFSYCKYSWLLDERSLIGFCEYSAATATRWAIEVKALQKVVCYVNFDILDGETQHVEFYMNSEYLGCGYEEEALKVLYKYAFEKNEIQRIEFEWAFEDEEKLAPLFNLGMKLIKTKDEWKKPVNLDRQRLIKTKEEWEKLKQEERYKACSLMITKDEFMELLNQDEET